MPANSNYNSINPTDVSIVILSFGDKSALEATVSSVNMQNVKPGECVVFEADADKYHTMALVKNDAVKVASLDYVLCLQEGYILQKDTVERLVSGEEQEHNIGQYNSICWDACMQYGVEAFNLMLVSKAALGVAGSWNNRLVAAEDYELFLRMAYFEQNVRVISCESISTPITKETYYTYGYILGKYATLLKESNAFDSTFMVRYNEAVAYGIDKCFVSVAQNMITRSDEFVSVDKETRGILVLTGESVCYGVLDEFAKDFARGLRRAGTNVIECSIAGFTEAELVSLAKKDYAAVVGFQTEVFTRMTTDGQLVGNLFGCPKYNYTFDHPLYISYHMMLPIEDYYVFSQDEGYVNYLNEYFANVKKAYHLPPAGKVAEKYARGEVPGWTDRVYDITFVGTYNDYRRHFDDIRMMEPKERRVALKLLNYMKHHPNVPIENALATVLETYGVHLGKKEFVVKLHKMKDVGRLIMFYYRERILRQLVESDIKVDVFFDSWKKCPFADNDYLKIHSDLSPEQCLSVYAQSKISLNIMSWHKGGMTERIANIMLNGAVCVTDMTTYIKREFSHREDVVLYDLEQLDKLPCMIKELLENNSQKSELIATAGRKKSLLCHTWDNRAEEFLNLLCGN